MIALLHAPILRALGYAIANSLWQTAFCWLVYLLLNAPGKFSSANKYLLAVLLQLTGFVWFLLTFRYYYFENIATPNTSTLELPAAGSGLPNFSHGLINWIGKAESMLPFLSLAYLLFIAFFLSKWIMGYYHTQTLRAKGIEEMSAHWRLFVKKIEERLSIQKGIGIFVSPAVTTPLTIGFLKPVILIPLASINHLTTEQLEAVILHEIAHIKRADYLTNLLLSVVELSLFFNPFSRLFSGIIQHERENSCDDWVLQFSYNAADYAAALLRIAYIQTPANMAMAAAGKKNELLHRIKRMIGEKDKSFNYPKQIVAFLLVTGLLSLLAWMSPAPQNSQPNNKVIAATSVPTTLPALPQAPVVKAEKIFDPVFLLPEKIRLEIKQQLAEVSTAPTFEHPPIVEKIEKQLPEQLPQIINNALKQAAFGLEETAISLGITEEKIKQQKKLMAPSVRLNKQFKDSIRSITLKRPSLNQDIQLAWQKIDEELNNAGPVMENKLTPAAPPIPDEVLMRIEINKALQEVKKLDLEKIIRDAVQQASLPETVIRQLLNLEKLQLSDKDKEILHKELKEKQMLRIQKIQAPKHSASASFVSIDNEMAPPITVTPNTEDLQMDINTTDDAQLIKLKLVLLKELKNLMTYKKLIPVLFYEQKILPKEPVIQHQ